MVAGRDLIDAVKKRLTTEGDKVPTDRAVAAHIGMHHVHFSQLKSKEALTAVQLANMIVRADATAFERGRTELIRTIVEFFPIEGAINGRGGVHQELFNLQVQGAEHPYRAGLRAELETKYGVYLFYDSRGRALYAGKAKQQSLWREMKSAFNRDRGALQKLSRVQHPEKRVPFRRADEKRRQILERNVPLAELAHYFSAYEVAPELVDGFEAFLIRAFPNDLLNKRKESLASQKTKKAL